MITATTGSSARCSVQVTYPDGYVSRARSLMRLRTSGRSGQVSWSWRVGSKSTGIAHADVNCTGGRGRMSGSTTFTIE